MSCRPGSSPRAWRRCSKGHHVFSAGWRWLAHSARFPSCSTAPVASPTRCPKASRSSSSMRTHGSGATGAVSALSFKGRDTNVAGGRLAPRSIPERRRSRFGFRSACSSRPARAALLPGRGRLWPNAARSCTGRDSVIDIAAADMRPSLQATEADRDPNWRPSVRKAAIRLRWGRKGVKPARPPGPDGRDRPRRGFVAPTPERATTHAGRGPDTMKNPPRFRVGSGGSIAAVRRRWRATSSE